MMKCKTIRRFTSCLLLALMLLAALLFLLGRFPVGIRYESPTRDMPAAATNGLAIVSAARDQIGVTVLYDPSYVTIRYPGGDVREDRGVCTDVVIRALRKAKGIDLQKLVHEDMESHFLMYPSLSRWLMLRPDPNIDHRRVLNLERFFGRKGWSLKVSHNPAVYLPGDIVTCRIGGNIPHIMIVSDRKSPDGTPVIIHNVGAGTREEDLLFGYEITGHHRLPTSKIGNEGY